MWLKVKARLTADCVIGGLNPGVGASIGSVAVGLYDGDSLVYVGSVGSGLTEGVRAVLLSRLRRTAEPPFRFGGRTTPRELRGAVWVVPDTVCEVGFAEVTREFRLRQPSFIGLREDKHPRECALEQLIRRGVEGDERSGRRQEDHREGGVT